METVGADRTIPKISLQTEGMLQPYINITTRPLESPAVVEVEAEDIRSFKAAARMGRTVQIHILAGIMQEPLDPEAEVVEALLQKGMVLHRQVGLV